MELVLTDEERRQIKEQRRQRAEERRIAALRERLARLLEAVHRGLGSAGLVPEWLAVNPAIDSDAAVCMAGVLNFAGTADTIWANVGDWTLPDDEGWPVETPDEKIVSHTITAVLRGDADV